MTDDLNALASELRALLDRWGLGVARPAFEQQAAALPPETREALALLVFGASDLGGANLAAANTAARELNQGAVNVGDNARVYGPTIGINLGKIIYGRDPQEDERRRLVWYLQTLAAKLYRLPLRGLEERLEHGKGIALPKIYVMLATAGEGVFVADSMSEDVDVADYFEDPEQTRLKRDYHPDWALPNAAIVDTNPRTENAVTEIYRAELATEAAQTHPRLVLLGDPGSGKSTFLRHFAWALAQRGLDQTGQAPALMGWADDRPALPILLSLRKLAGQLATKRVSDATVYVALRDELQSYGVGQIDDLLNESLHRGAALLLLDGLDEVPLDAQADVIDRAATLRAMREIARRYPQARVVVTCRTRAFSEDLRDLLDWPVEIISPFTLGQVRHFVPAWYRELVAARQIDAVQAQALCDDLLAAITDPLRPRLRPMAANPLLLTMMALVLYNKGALPRDRPQLYERILDLLLGQWDQVREGQTLAEHLEVPGLTSERLRPLLDQLSYEAHVAATSVDGRGRLARGAVRDALIGFFEREHPRRAWDLAQRCLDYIEQRSGLLAPDGPDSFVFAHLTLQEHCAGRHMLLDRDAVSRVLQHRADDRWREPISLGLGVVQQTNPWLIESLLRHLIDREEGERPKPIERWYRDLILAAEIGADRDWVYLRDQRVDVGALQRDLKRGLVALLQDKVQPLPVAERVRSGFLLGDLGDPRSPVTIADWRREVQRALAGDTDGYFCRIEPGDYIIGSPDDDPAAQYNEKPQHAVTFDTPFWSARFPITNAQWQIWVQDGGESSYFIRDPDLNHPNQPVVAVTWHMCHAFCAWLSKQTAATLRLPTEAEWEAAACGGDVRRYPWGDDWQDDRAAMEEDQELRGAQYTAPVGCYPAGAAPCGALDLAGNVWEWTASEWRSYSGAAKPFTHTDVRVLRGGAYYMDRPSVRCAARIRFRPDDFNVYYGFRVFLTLGLAY